MGRDKARLRVNDHLLIEEVANAVASITGNVTLVGAAHRYRDLPCESIDDLCPGCGPLSGIQAALASKHRGYWNAIVACDMPGLKPEWLAHLIHKAEEPGAGRCIVARDVNGTIHPLCGIWRGDCLAVVDHALARGRFRLFDVLDQLNATHVSVDSAMHNVNTPEEWTAWQRHRAPEALGPR